MNVGQRVIVVNQDSTLFNKQGVILEARPFGDGIMYGVLLDDMRYPSDVLAFLPCEVAAI